MAHCYAPEMDDLHRRWLPREIFADIGIADAASVHLTASIFGGEELAPPAPHHRQHQTAQVCGFEGSVLTAYGGGGAPGASPYSTLQWQVATNFANGGRVRVMPAPVGPYYGGAPPAKRRLGGTGVFLPRTEAHQYQHKAAVTTKPPSKAADVKTPNEGCEKTKLGDGQEDEQWQKVATAAEKTMTTTTTQLEGVSAALLALPQEWTY